ncbi:Mitochondrial carrier -like protein 2, partial [Caligus rogercresseyi]
MSLFLSATPKPSSAVSPEMDSWASIGTYPKLIELRISGIVSDQVKAYFDYNKLEGIPDEDLTPEERNSRRRIKDDALLSDEERKQKYLDKGSGNHLTQPFHVITIRTIAQFVGGEDKYGILSSFKTLIEDNGILGFWSGLIPRVIGEVLTIGLSTFITYLVNKHVIKDKDLQRYSPMVAYLASSSLFYPFQ